MSLTPEDIKDLRRKLSEATPGIWIDMGDTEPWPGTVIATTVPDGGVTPVCIDPEADDRPADRDCIAALHNAAPALLDAADDLATVTRERDDALGEVDALASVGKRLLDRAELLEMERDELRAALLNERGEGTGPSEGWEYQACAGWGMCWVRGGGPDDWIAVTRKPAGGWYVRLGAAFANRSREFAISIGTARDAMARVDTALAGAKS